MSKKQVTRYDGLLEAFEAKEEQAVQEIETITATAVAEPETTTIREEKRRGRPAGGKSTNPDYTQVSAYVPKQVKADAEIGLLKEGMKTGKRREFSDLVEELLIEWNRKNN